MILQNDLNPKDEVSANLLEMKKTFLTAVDCRNLAKWEKIEVKLVMNVDFCQRDVFLVLFMRGTGPDLILWYPVFCSCLTNKKA